MLLIVVSFFLVLSLAAVIIGKSYAAKYQEGYEAGRLSVQAAEVGTYSDGYRDGISRAQHAIEDLLMDDAYHLSCEIEETYGISPDMAIATISNYLDLPGEITESELFAASLAIHRYYTDLQDILQRVDEYSID